MGFLSAATFSKAAATFSPSTRILMKYPFNLSAIPAGLFKVAQAPEIGVDSYIARFSPNVPVHIASVRFTAHNAATLETTGASIPTGFYLCARVFGGPLYGQNVSGTLTPIILTVAATLFDGEDPVADNLVATFTSPAWSLKSLNLYPKFTTRDLIPSVGGNVNFPVTALGALESVSGGAAGDLLEIWAFPPASSYYLIDCVRDKNGGPPPDQIIAIACGRNPQAHVKQGRAEVQELELTMPYKGYLEQLARFQGVKGTVAIEIRKDDQAFTQVELYGGYIPAMTHPRSGDNDEVEATFTAPFEQFFAGYAV